MTKNITLALLFIILTFTIVVLTIKNTNNKKPIKATLQNSYSNGKEPIIVSGNGGVNLAPTCCVKWVGESKPINGASSEYGTIPPIKKLIK